VSSGGIPPNGDSSPEEILKALREALTNNPRLDDLPVEEIVRQLVLERVMNLGESRIEMRISRSAWFPRDLRFPHS
jgi:hypothetical protein